MDSGENYQAAYDSLVEVYENQYRITIALLDQLFKFDPLKTVSHDNLRKLIDTVKCSIRQLTVAGSPVDHWDHILVHFALTRMPRATLSIWGTTNDLKAMPTLNVVSTFLGRRTRGNKNLNLVQSTNGSQQQQQQHHSNSGTKPKHSNQGGYGNAASKQSAESSGVTCCYCKQPHPTHRCAQLRRMNSQEYRSNIRDLKLCYVCLSPGH